MHELFIIDCSLKTFQVGVYRLQILLPEFCLSILIRSDNLVFASDLSQKTHEISLNLIFSGHDYLHPASFYDILPHFINDC